MRTKDIALYSKKDNFGCGELDIDIKDGVVGYVEDADLVLQAFMKATIASKTGRGYGASARELRGTKHPFIARSSLGSPLSGISRWI